MEARRFGITGCRCFVAPQAGVPYVLACVRGVVEFGWPRFSNIWAYLLPFTAGFLALALAAMGFRANSRHGYGPFLLGVVATVGVLLGKFRWESKATMYGAVGLLVLASLWNTWPRRATSKEASCADCGSENVS